MTTLRRAGDALVALLIPLSIGCRGVPGSAQVASRLTRDGLLSLRYGDSTSIIEAAVGSPLRAEIRGEGWVDPSKNRTTVLVYATQSVFDNGVAVFIHIKDGRLSGVYAKESDEWFYVLDEVGPHFGTTSKLDLIPSSISDR